MLRGAVTGHAHQHATCMPWGPAALRAGRARVGPESHTRAPGGRASCFSPALLVGRGVAIRTSDHQYNRVNTITKSTMMLLTKPAVVARRRPDGCADRLLRDSVCRSPAPAVTTSCSQKNDGLSVGGGGAGRGQLPLSLLSCPPAPIV